VPVKPDVFYPRFSKIGRASILCTLFDFLFFIRNIHFPLDKIAHKLYR